tara:strand:- start:1758 stop:2693 length:936 start_codon:yes stop_codon:yes gene_type:complete
MKILVTGGTGLVGNALQKIHVLYPEDEFVFIGYNDCDLTNYMETKTFFKNIEPQCVIHLAACVGGLYKNMNNKVEMFEKNILMNYNVLKSCYEVGCMNCLSCLSTCIFPDKTTYPINEKMLHDGPPHHSNDAYAYAKRMLEIQSKCYNEQYGTNFICVIPTNIYGPHDNFHLEDGHVIPSLIHKCYLAKKLNQGFIIRGTGAPLRQFIFSEDLARLMMYVLKKYKSKETIILSPSEKDEISILNMGAIIADSYKYFNIIFDESFSDGQYKKTANNQKLLSILEDEFEFTPIKAGIEKTVQWFIDNYETCRK